MLHDHCTQSGCKNPAVQRYDGKLICPPHYFSAFQEDVSGEYAAWEPGTGPSHRLRYLVGRVLEELGTTLGTSFLSQARIRDRAFGWVKIEDGGKFSITRHHGAWSERRPMERVVENWRFNLESREFALLGSRGWQVGDPD